MVRRSPFGILSQITMSRLPMVLIRSDSPRVYVSTNPWKVTSTFQTVSSTRDEYVALIGKLKASAPTKPKMKAEFAHQNLTMTLEGRLEVVDKEIMVCFLRGVVDHFLQSPCHSTVFLPVASRTHLFFFQRLQRARKKAEQRNLFLAQAEIRQTRTRRQTHRPDYVYYDVESSDVCLSVSGLGLAVVELFGYRTRRMANTNIRRMVFPRTRMRILRIHGQILRPQARAIGAHQLTWDDDGRQGPRLLVTLQSAQLLTRTNGPDGEGSGGPHGWVLHQMLSLMNRHQNVPALKIH